MANRLETLEERQDINARNDYAANSALRKAMRVRRTAHKSLEREAESKGLGIDLLPTDHAEADNDALIARNVQFASKHAGFKVGHKKKMATLQAQSIFANGSAGASTRVDLAQKRAQLLHNGARVTTKAASVKPLTSKPAVVVLKRKDSIQRGEHDHDSKRPRKTLV